MNHRLPHRLYSATLGLAAALLCLAAPSASATTVRMQTSLGNIDIELMDAAAPATVANFLAYVKSGAYTDSFIHRSVPGFVIQGGGYRWNNSTNGVANIAQNAPVINEYSATRSNLRGTIAMAKVGTDPNSATNQWFFNLNDNNAGNLDNQNGGFTVFGKVIGTGGMQVVDAIAALQRVNAGSPFDTLPVVSVPTSGPITKPNLVIIGTVTILPELKLVAGWNLVGNGVEAPLTVADVFNDSTKIATVWKWVTSGTTAGVTYPTWAFYAPSEPNGGSDYAANKGYDFLTTIAAGQGFWVNAKAAFSAPLQSSTAVTSASFKPATGAHALPHGWNLIATGDAPTPAQFAAAIATGAATGQVHTSLTTLWAWDASQAGWYFWAPSLVNDGSLANYRTSKGYRDFATLPATPTGTLAPATGFWVNMP